MQSALQTKRSHIQSQWRMALRGAWIGALVGVFFAGLGCSEQVESFHFLSQEATGKEMGVSINKLGMTSSDVPEKRQKVESELVHEPAIRVVTLWGIQIAEEYAGPGPATPLGHSGYFLEGNWRWRLQWFFGMMGAFLGILFAQQRTMNELLRRMEKLNRSFSLQQDTDAPIMAPQFDSIPANDTPPLHVNLNVELEG